MEDKMEKDRVGADDEVETVSPSPQNGLGGSIAHPVRRSVQGAGLVDDYRTYMQRGAMRRKKPLDGSEDRRPSPFRRRDRPYPLGAQLIDYGSHLADDCVAANVSEETAWTLFDEFCTWLKDGLSSVEKSFDYNPDKELVPQYLARIERIQRDFQTRLRSAVDFRKQYIDF